MHSHSHRKKTCLQARRKDMEEERMFEKGPEQGKTKLWRSRDQGTKFTMFQSWVYAKEAVNIVLMF